MNNQEIHQSSSYLTFNLNQDSFAISVSHVMEIMESAILTIVPNASRFVKGVLNFRGVIVPVVNMHERFNVQPDEDTPKMVVIVDLETDESHMYLGLLVDQVNEVVEIELKDIRNVPDMGIHYMPEFLVGVVNNDNKFLMVLDLDNVLSPPALAESHAS